MASFAQLAVAGGWGAVYYFLVTGRQSDNKTANKSNDNPFLFYYKAYTADNPLFRCITAVSLCNAVGCVATNTGYLYGSVSGATTRL